MSSNKLLDVIIIGGGQSGLAVGYYLRRTGLSYVILDAESKPGGAWQHMWPSLRLFSPAQWSSLPGVIMQGGPDYYPTRDQTVEYLQRYEQKYNLNVVRPVVVNEVHKTGDHFTLNTSQGTYRAKTIVSATGIFKTPVIPSIPGLSTFKGTVIHSSAYISPEPFRGQRVAIVGEGNSGAQILAEVSRVAKTVWITLKDPSFLPDHVDGRFLFDAASQMYEAKKHGKSYQPPSLGQIVMVPPVAEAKSRGAYQGSHRSFTSVESDSLVWSDGHEEKVDVIIFCTGFHASLKHLESLGLVNTDGKVTTNETRAINTEGLWLVGYGNWTGFASATLIGVGRSAKAAVGEIVQFLSVSKDDIAIL